MARDLILHCGANPITREALALINAPPATATWRPVKHSDFLESVLGSLGNAGFQVEKEQYGVTAEGRRFFATLNLRNEIAEGVGLAVGLRNSIDKSLPLGFAAGSSVFVCDNLSFHSELVCHRKHTLRGLPRFGDDINAGIGRLAQFQDAERARIEWMKTAELGELEASHFILRALESEIISTRNVLDVLHEWKAPRHPEFAERNRWSLFNAATEVLKPIAVANPIRFTRATMALHGLLGKPELAPVGSEGNPIKMEPDYSELLPPIDVFRRPSDN